MPRIYLFLTLLLSPVLAHTETRLPSFMIRIPDSLDAVFVAETSTAKFHRFERVDGAMTHVGSVHMSIGRHGAGKEKNGDKRTPLGIYFVTEELDTDRMHEQYGVAAFVLDYPNVWDQRLNRRGDGIWVHGVDPAGGKRPARDTDGCIALPNGVLDVLDDTFVDNVTPVLISRVVDWSEPKENLLIEAELEKNLLSWSTSQVNGDLHAYLSLYDEKFERWSMSKSDWSALSLSTFANSTMSALSISNLLVLAYPHADDIYLTRFEQTIMESDRRRVSTKRLFWHRSAHGAFKVIAEDEG